MDLYFYLLPCCPLAVLRLEFDCCVISSGIWMDIAANAVNASVVAEHCILCCAHPFSARVQVVPSSIDPEKHSLPRSCNSETTAQMATKEKEKNENRTQG